MPRPTVSVIIPVHHARIVNGMLNRALNSVQAQTVLPDAIIVAIDNDREGACATRQRALMSATTDFVSFLDSDDMFLPKHLEWLLKHQRETGADFVYSWFKILQQFADGSTRVLEEDSVFPVTHRTTASAASRPSGAAAPACPTRRRNGRKARGCARM